MKPLLGIFGGTFDPFHNGHLLVAERLLENFNFSEIKFTPCKIPVHKNNAHASAQQRVEMLKLALQGSSKLTIDERELKRTTPSYMIETLQSLGEDYPEEPLVLIIGTDSFTSLHHWYKWQHLTDYAHIIVVRRPGVELYWPEKLAKHFKSKIAASANELYSSNENKLYFFETETQQVSSTELRKKLNAKEDVSKILPEIVATYIGANNLYKE